MFLLVLLCAAVVSWACAGVLRKAPVAFYIAALVIDVVYAIGAVGMLPMPVPVWSALIALVQKCSIALALFSIVMFIGVFPSKSTVGIRLRPVRAELSIVGCILALGHVFAYVVPYTVRVFSGAGTGNIVLSFSVALVTFVLMIVLGVTSFEFVKRHMSHGSWKKLQRCAYAFFALAYAHIALILMPSAISGGLAAAQSMAIYTIVFVAYAIARIVRWRLDASGSVDSREYGFAYSDEENSADAFPPSVA